MNVQGSGNKSKRAAIIKHLEHFRPNIICLSDTRLDQNSENYVLNEFQYKGYFNSFTSNSRGVCILISKSFPISVENIKKDNRGNWIALSLLFDSHRFNLINIYGPNEDNPSFFENIFDTHSRATSP